MTSSFLGLPTTGAWGRLAALAIAICLLLAGCDNDGFSMTPSRKPPDASEFFRDPQPLEMARAIETEDLQKIEALAKSLDINARHHRGMTYLMWAMARGKLSSFKSLLALGADYSMKVEKKSVPGMALLMQLNPNNPKLIDARYYIALVEAGFDPNGRTESGTPLWFDALGSYTASVLEYLLERGNLDINARDNGGNTATMWLARREQYKQVMKLLEQGAQLNPENHLAISFAYDVQYNIVPPDSPEHYYREKILEMLRASGVRFPVLRPYEERQSRKQQQEP